MVPKNQRVGLPGCLLSDGNAQDASSKFQGRLLSLEEPTLRASNKPTARLRLAEMRSWLSRLSPVASPLANRSRFRESDTCVPEPADFCLSGLSAHGRGQRRSGPHREVPADERVGGRALSHALRSIFLIELVREQANWVVLLFHRKEIIDLWIAIPELFLGVKELIRQEERAPSPVSDIDEIGYRKISFSALLNFTLK